MKIMDSKGVKRDVSSFFHSKSRELRFKNYYFVAILLLLLVFMTLSTMIVIFIQALSISSLLVVLLAALLYICKQRFLSNSIIQLMKFIDSSNIDRKNKKNRKYFHMNSIKKRDVFKKRKFSKFHSLKNFLKDKIFKQNDDDSSYIEIK